MNAFCEMPRGISCGNEASVSRRRMLIIEWASLPGSFQLRMRQQHVAICENAPSNYCNKRYDEIASEDQAEFFGGS